MRRSKTICLLCRHAPIARSYMSAPNRGLRHISRTEALTLPPLAIDLDAYDSPAVRQTPNSDYEYPDTALPWPPDLPLSKKSRALLATPRDPVDVIPRKNAKQVTPPDLLTWALRGDTRPAHPNQWGRKLFRGDLRSTDNIDAQAQLFTFRFKTYTSEWDSEHAALTLRTTSEFRKLKPMISILCGTRKGCLWLVEHGKTLRSCFMACERHAAQEKLDESNTWPHFQRTALVNDMFWAMQSRAVEMGPELCNLGLFYACKERCHQTTKFYLELCLRSPPREDKFANRALSAFCQGILDAKNVGDSANEALDMWLLTGSTDENGVAVDELPCFSTLVKRRLTTGWADNQKLFIPIPYVIWLGELGLAKTLHREWEAITRQNSTVLDTRATSLLFAVGLLLARDQQGASSVLAKGFLETGAIDSETEKGSLRLSARERSTLLSILVDLYTEKGVDGTNLINHLKEQIKDSATPQVFLNRLSVFLMFDAPTIFRRSREIWQEEEIDGRRSIHLAEYGGERGILVLPQRGSTPLYFKAERSFS